MGDLVEVERQGHVLCIRFNRADKKNALTGAMYRRATQALGEAEEDASVRVALLTGGPTDFTAGNDLNDFLDPNRDAGASGSFLAALPKFSKPLVAAVNGYAVGIGTTMLLHCDLVYVGYGARLKMPFVDLGAVPECASSLLLPQLVGAQRAAALLLLSEMFDGEQAVKLGLAAEVLHDDQVQARALEQAQLLASKPPMAVRSTKALLRAANADLIEGVMQREGAIFAECLKSPEAREAMSAVMEKRKPDFSKL